MAEDNIPITPRYSATVDTDLSVVASAYDASEHWKLRSPPSLVRFHKALASQHSQLTSLPAETQRFRILQCEFLKQRKDIHEGSVLKGRTFLPWAAHFSAATTGSSTLQANKAQQVPSKNSYGSLFLTFQGLWRWAVTPHWLGYSVI